MNVVGKVVQYTLAKLKPNPWNPNEMDDFTFQSLKHGFETDGWLVSQSLLVWGKDETGERRDLIIDGEHRWLAATQLELAKGPCVFIDGIDEDAAKELTIKLDNKRGKFNRSKLAGIVTELLKRREPVKLGLALGISSNAMTALLKPAPRLTTAKPSRNVHSKSVPLFFDEKTHDEFTRLVGVLEQRYKTDTITETVMAALTAAEESTKRRRA